MDREVRYRLFRIILVIFIFLCFTFLRESVGESYVEAREVESFLSKPLVMEQVATLESKINTDSKYYSYSLKITNEAAIFRSGDIIFSSDGDFGKVKYQILKDDTVVKTGVLKNNHVLYAVDLNPNSSDIYEVRFLIENSSSLNGEIILI